MGTADRDGARARAWGSKAEDLIVLCRDCYGDDHRALVQRAIRATRQEPLAVMVADVLRGMGD